MRNVQKSHLVTTQALPPLCTPAECSKDQDFRHRMRFNLTSIIHLENRHFRLITTLHVVVSLHFSFAFLFHLRLPPQYHLVPLKYDMKYVRALALLGEGRSAS